MRIGGDKLDRGRQGSKKCEVFQLVYDVTVVQGWFEGVDVFTRKADSEDRERQRRRSNVAQDSEGRWMTSRASG